MSKFTTVAQVGELQDPGKQLIEVDDQFVVLCLIAGEYFCVDDVCTHDGGTLGDGELCGHELICPRHGARFDVRNGAALCMPATEGTGRHEVRVDGSDIQVMINAD